MAPEDRRPDPGDPPEGSPFAVALGRAIKVLRTLQGIDRKDLADRAGLSYSYLAEIENGKKSPSASAQKAIADALGLPVVELHSHAKKLLHEIRAGRSEDLTTLGVSASISPDYPSPSRALAETAPYPASGARTRSLRWFQRLRPASLEEDAYPAPDLEDTVEQWLGAISDRLAASAGRVERELEVFRNELARYREALDELRAAEQRGSAEREELGKRLSRWQDRFDRRLQELTVEVARLTERQQHLATQVRDGESGRRGGEES